jgi:hypothetical protein
MVSGALFVAGVVCLVCPDNYVAFLRRIHKGQEGWETKSDADIKFSKRVEGFAEIVASAFFLWLGLC